ncbi:phage holin family protein [Actinobacillus genomosp. 2]|uniref:HP1 family phage holin n=1 Tax=Actinobacillus genomosp. 2 TaxID=230709 RepID=UPI0024421D50|nr:HP1 family phage holin [Actinobacillus genomosp. 2]WGE32552.1 phage holin family protein [Actinobacillus genomosp. 2]
MNGKFEGSVPFIGSLVAFLSGFNVSEWAALFGILFGAITVLIAYKKYKDEIALRKQELHYKILAARIEAKKLGVSDESF